MNPPKSRLHPRHRVVRWNETAPKASPSPAMRFRVLLRLLGSAVLLTAASAPARDVSVTASATAGADYVRPHDAKGAPLPETYVFAEGRFFGGNIRDGSLEQMTFADITRTLAVSLAKQSYLPTPDAASAGLLIMVHWGTTDAYDDPMKEANQQALNDALTTLRGAESANQMTDTSAVRAAMSAVNSSTQGQASVIERNAVLLGYARSLRKQREKFDPAEETRLSTELAEERYFVVLMAYDNQARLKDKKSRPLWVTRLSVRSAGNNFTEAMPALARAGAEIFGQQREDLVRVKTPLRPGSVKLGELEVLGPVGDQPAPAPGK